MRFTHFVVFSIIAFSVTNSAHARYLQQMSQYGYVNSRPPAISAQPVPQGQYTDGMNLYQYVRSQPTIAIDPMGLNANWQPYPLPDGPSDDPLYGFPEGDCIGPNCHISSPVSYPKLETGCVYVGCGKMKADEYWWEYILYPIVNAAGVRHCEPRDNASGMGRDDETFYDTWIDRSPGRKLLAGDDSGTSCKCATCPQIQECVSAAYHQWSSETTYAAIGNNCHAGTTVALSKCCLKTRWKPNWHGYTADTHPLCTKWDWYIDEFSSLWQKKCVEWLPSIH